MMNDEFSHRLHGLHRWGMNDKLLIISNEMEEDEL
jgi:hypothetical protein